MMKKYALSAILVLLFALRLSAQNTAVQVFDVRKYGAKGDGSTDDTANIDKAVEAAKAYVAANTGGKASIAFPRGTYIVGTGVLANASGVLIDGDGLEISGEGMLKAAAGSAQDGVLRVTGNYNTIQGIFVDGNASGSPSGRGECVRVSGNYNTLFNVTAQNSKTTGATGMDFLIIETSAGTDGIGNKLVCCMSKNAGQNGFDNRGDYTTIRDCQALEFGVHGYNHAGEYTEQVTVDGFYAASTISTAVTGFIMDPGSGTDNYVKQATITNVRIGPLPNINTSTGVLVKIARVHDLLIDRMFVEHTTLVPSIKIVEACKAIKIRDSYFSRAIDFDELGSGTSVTNSFASTANNGGFVEITGASHGHAKRDVVYIVSSEPSLNGLFEVTSVPTANTFVIDCLRTAGTDAASGNWYDAQGPVVLDNVQIGEPAVAQTAFRLSGLRTPRLTMRNCAFYGCSTKAVAVKQTYPLTAIERYDIENCFFEFNRNASDAVCLSAEDSTDFFTSSRKVRWVNNSYRNLLNATVKLTKQLDSDILLTSLDGGRDFVVSIDPSTASGTEYDAVSWQVGDRLWKATSSRDDSPGWICTTAGTIDGASVFTAMPALATINTLVDNVTEVGNVGSGEDNLITYTLPANTLNEAGASLEIEAGFTFNTNANSKTIKLYLGSADLLALSGAAQNGGSYFVRAVVTRDASNIAKVAVVGGTHGGTGTPLGNIGGNVFNHTADMTTALTIKGTGTATSDNDVVMEFLRVKTIPAP